MVEGARGAEVPASEFVTTSGEELGARIDEAVGLLEQLTRQDELADFLTLPAYERLP